MGLQRRRPNQAVNHFRHALRLKLDHAEALRSLGIALAGQGRLEEAPAQ